MLVHLSIRNFAIIDALDLPLGPGMTVLTGETGAGKSIVVDALSLLTGARAKGDAIRAGADEAEIAGQFAVFGELAKELDARLAAEGLATCDDGALILRRVLSREGRHRQFINGTLATVAQLKGIAEGLVDFTGQHAQQMLLRPGAQLDLLDAFGGCESAQKEVASRHRAARALQEERDALRASEHDKVQRADWLRFQIDEIAQVSPKVGEEDALSQERARLMNTDRLRGGVSDALALLGAEGDANTLGHLQTAARVLERLGNDDAELGSLAGTLFEASALVDDVIRSLSRHANLLDDDPARLEEVDDRLDAIRRLLRKHGQDVAAVLDAQARMQSELDALENSEERLKALERELAEAHRALQTACDTLTGKRRAAARRLGPAIEAELRDLGMPSARIEVEVTALVADASTPLVAHGPDGARALTATGQDRVQLLLAANPGEPAGPVAKIASGGELSRVLLAVKRVLLERDPVPLSIFDEVDAGVGGAVGEIIGDKLAAIADGRQVLCVTHLGQIASLGHRHLKVEKVIEGGRTSSRVLTLDEDERIEELARMMGGKKITDATLAHARDMRSRHQRGASPSDVAPASSSSAPDAAPKGAARKSAPSKTPAPEASPKASSSKAPSAKGSASKGTSSKGTSSKGSSSKAPSAKTRAATSPARGAKA